MAKRTNNYPQNTTLKPEIEQDGPH